MIKKLFFLSLILFPCLSYASGIYNPGSSGGSGAATLPLPPGDTNYIQNKNSLQSGATFYVSSGTVNGQLNIVDASSQTALVVSQSVDTGNSVVEFHANSQNTLYGIFNAFNDTFSKTIPIAYFFGYNNGNLSFGNAGTGAGHPRLGFFTENAYSNPYLVMNGGSGGNGYGGVTLGDGVGFTYTPNAPGELYSNTGGTLRNSVVNIGAITHDFSGAGSDGVGAGLGFWNRDSTSMTQAAEVDGIWATATHASRKGRMTLNVLDAGGTRNGIQIDTDGTNPYETFSGSATFVSSVTITSGLLTVNASGIKFSDGTIQTSSAPAGGGGVASADFMSTLVNTPRTLGSTTTLTSSDFQTVVFCTGTTNDYTVTLPASSGNNYKLLTIQISTSCTRLITISAAGSDTIDGASSRIMWAGEGAVLLSNNPVGGWNKVAGKSIPMSANMTLTGAQQNFVANTYTLVPLDTKVSDNVGSIVDTTNHRLYIKRTGIYICTGYITFDPGNNPGGVWAGTSGTQVDILNNAAAGGAAWTTAKGAVTNASGVDVVPVATGAFSLTAGQYIAMDGYAGATGGNFNNGPSGSNCGLGLTEMVAW